MGQTNLLNSNLKVIYYSALAGTDDSVVPSNTQTVAYSFNVDAGVYIAFANVRWSSNAKGSRHIGFAEKTTESFSDMNAHYSIVAPSTDGMTFQNLAVILKYENPAHVEIRVQQFSGSDLKIQTRLSLLKVKWRFNEEITDIQLTLENETNRNIKIIAEGHLDLSRKLDDALKVDTEKEMLLIRVNRLENEVRRLKERISEIA